jgi:hypothetical protein
VRSNLHWYLAVAVIVSGLVGFLQELVLLGNVLVVAGCSIWTVGYVLQTRRLRASFVARPTPGAAARSDGSRSDPSS